MSFGTLGQRGAGITDYFSIDVRLYDLIISRAKLIFLLHH
jgi:hypothetical protein